MAQPWRCEKCGLFVYNRDENGYPADGAPECQHIMAFGRVCEVCHELWWNVFKSEYWRHVQAEASAEERRKNPNKR